MSAISYNVCDAPLRPRFGEVIDPQTGERFRIDECAACGLGHTLPQPADLDRYYGEKYYGDRHGLTATLCANRRLRFVRSVVPAEGGSRKLLDVGCGDGLFLELARSKGWKVAGTEINPAAACRRGLTVFETIDDAVDSGPFDCVTLWHSLEHLRDPRKSLEKLRELVSPGGSILIAVPDAAGMQARVFGSKWFHLDVPRHLFHFGDRSLTPLLERTGFRPVTRWHQELEYDLFGWTQSALNCVMREPNTFFYHLTGRPVRSKAWSVAANYVLGSALTLTGAMPLTALATAAGRGGTLVVAARRRDDRERPSSERRTRPSRSLLPTICSSLNRGLKSIKNKT